METIVDTPNNKIGNKIGNKIVESGGHIESIIRVYLFLGLCFSYPQKEFYDVMKGAGGVKELGALIEGLPFKVNFKGNPSPSLHHEDFENEYVNTLDMAGSRPLYESAYTAYRDDMCSRDIYEDILRFYDHFGIKLREKERDYPDHLVAELEFMAFLVQKEADAEKCGKDPNPYRLAQRDFLERHLNKWVYKLNERIQKRLKEPFYKGASAFMVEFLRDHYSYLKKLLNESRAV